MQHSLSFIHGYATCDYQIVIQPHEDLCNKVNTIKKLFAETYGLPIYHYAKPNITLVRFTQYEMMEERITRSIKTIATANAPFKIELKDYACFPTHTIYINIATKVQVQNLMKKLKQVQKLVRPDEGHKPHFIADPYITIAAKLLPWQYEKGWLQYSHSHFSGAFMANEILLLKRRSGDKAYTIAAKFHLLNQSTKVEQSILF